jgi:putative Holliday junction resolvase
MSMGRYLGIDAGERRIGLAVSLPEGRLAVPLRVLESKGDDADARTIRDVAREEDVETIVLGHPLSLDGSAGPQAKRVEAFAAVLRDVSGLPVKMWDERLSTAQAARTAPPGRRGKNRRPRDDVAAAIILQAYLDRLGAQAPPGE